MHYHSHLKSQVQENTQHNLRTTSVLRYYKRLTLPEMKICEIPLDEASLSWKYEMSTLLVSYKKPVGVLEEVGIDVV